MKKHKAAILGGLVAGVVTTAFMVAGRKAGLLTKTLDRDAVDWIDRTTGARDVIGDGGINVVEFANHLGASAAFGAALPTLREWAPNLSPVALGTLYGTALYVVRILTRTATSSCSKPPILIRVRVLFQGADFRRLNGLKD